MVACTMRNGAGMNTRQVMMTMAGSRKGTTRSKRLPSRSPMRANPATMPTPRSTAIRQAVASEASTSATGAKRRSHHQVTADAAVDTAA